MKITRRSQRLHTFGQALHGGGVLHLRDAAQVLGVSEMTVRRDVAGVPERFGTLGGYTVTRTADGLYVLAQEQTVHEAAKATVCARAAALIEDDDTIFIDCGTTMPHLVRHLRPGLSVTALCYALNVATPLALCPNVRLILLGGAFHPSSASFAVDESLAAVARLGINRAFISASGVHADKGVTCSNFHEVAVKQAVLRAAVERILVVDDSKFGKVKPARFAPFDAFDTLITNEAGGRNAARDRFPGRFIAV